MISDYGRRQHDAGEHHYDWQFQQHSGNAGHSGCDINLQRGEPDGISAGRWWWSSCGSG
jgi:hypothetical protein